MIKKMNRITPEKISSLNDNEIFVFGSNTEGFHGAGAAANARQWGAKIGVGVGLSGQTYAIPTKKVVGMALETMFISEIKPYVDEFIRFAALHQKYHFLVTKLGTGLAGLSMEQVAPLFKKAIYLSNISLPIEFWEILT